MADEAILIGPPQPTQSYLNIETVIAAAKSVGAEAIHPGYGFLSERPEFADACEKAGIEFIGPTADQMRESPRSSIQLVHWLKSWMSRYCLAVVCWQLSMMP